MRAASPRSNTGRTGKKKSRLIGLGEGKRKKEEGGKEREGEGGGGYQSSEGRETLKRKGASADRPADDAKGEEGGGRALQKEAERGERGLLMRRRRGGGVPR